MGTPVSDLPANVKPLTVSVKIGKAILGLGNTKFYELINAGSVRTIKVGRKTLVVYASLEELVARAANRGG